MNKTYSATNGKEVSINEKGEIKVDGIIVFYSAPEANERDYNDYCNWNDGIRETGNGNHQWSQGMYDG